MLISVSDRSQKAHEMLCRRLQATSKLQPDEEGSLSAIRWDVLDLPAKTDFILEGERPTRCCLVLDGLAMRSNVTKAGERQIESVHIPGDIPDLQSLHLARMDHFIGTITPCRLAFVAHDELRAICERSPKLAARFWRETMIDASKYRATIVRIARLGATERLGHFLCEIKLRLEAVGLTSGSSFLLPLTQEVLGQVLGLSIVSANRSLQWLRSEGVLTWDRGRVEILDWKRLVNLSQFDPSFLHLDER